MTIERHYRLPVVFMFLIAFKAGFHSVTQIFQGPWWGGIILGVIYGYLSIKLLLLMFRISERPRFIALCHPHEYDWPLNSVHREYLNKLDCELTSILSRDRSSIG